MPAGIGEIDATPGDEREGAVTATTRQMPAEEAQVHAPTILFLADSIEAGIRDEEREVLSSQYQTYV
jgi:hypothetical protein